MIDETGGSALSHNRRGIFHKGLFDFAKGLIPGGIGGFIPNPFGGGGPPGNFPTGGGGQAFGTVEMSFADPSFVNGITTGSITASDTDARCGQPLFRNRITKKCEPSGGSFDPTPDFDTPAEMSMGNGSIHQEPHGDQIPRRVARSVRRCPRGMVLGKRGWCHSKIANKDRMYPKPRKALGTAGDLNAVTKAKAFSTRLVNNQKSLKKTAANFAKASNYFRGKPGK